MTNKKIIIFISIFIFFILVIINILILNTLCNKNSFTKNNAVNNIIKEIKKCERSDYFPRKEISGWKTYFNDDYCLSFQYPEEWKIIESLGHIDPYIYISNTAIDEFDKDKKIVINIFNKNFFSSFSATNISAFKNPKLSSIWQGSQPASRIKGEIEQTDILKKLKSSHNYSDIIIMPREGKYNDDLFFVMSYNEEKFSETDRDMFNKMYESFNIIDF